MPDTVLSLIQEALTALSALDAKVTALDTKVSTLTGADNAALAAVRQLASDTQMAVLHIQDTLGHPNG